MQITHDSNKKCKMVKLDMETWFDFFSLQQIKLINYKTKDKNIVLITTGI